MSCIILPTDWPEVAKKALSGQNIYFEQPRVNPGLSFLAPSGGPRAA